MTDLATALANPPGQLHPFDGRDVLRSTIAVTNAGDGLSEAMAIEPREFSLDERVYVVLECTVSKVLFKELPEKDGDGLVRTHTLAARAATIVDADLVHDQIKAQKDRIREAREKAAGVVPLFVAGDADPEPTDADPDDGPVAELPKRGR